MAKHKRPSTWIQQAALQALVRYGPEESGLRAAAQEAKSTYHTTVRQADATSRALRYEVDRARPDVVHNYDTAGLQQAAAAHVAAPDLSAPGVPASLRAAVAAENQGYTSRLAESRTADLNNLNARRVDAVAGAGYAKTNAQNVLASSLSKLFQRSQDLAGEKGGFTVATAQQLKTAADRAAATEANQKATRGQQERNSLRSAGIDPDTGKPIPNGRLDPKAKSKTKGQTRGGATRSALSGASDEISRLIGDAAPLAKGGASRHDLAALYLNGAKEVRKPVYDKLGKKVIGPDGTAKEKVIPGVDKAKSALLLSAALDVVYDGHVSRRNHQLLLHRGLSIRDLGLPSYGDYVKRRQRRAAARNKAAGGTLAGPAF